MASQVIKDEAPGHDLRSTIRSAWERAVETAVCWPVPMQKGRVEEMWKNEKLYWLQGAGDVEGVKRFSTFWGAGVPLVLATQVQSYLLATFTLSHFIFLGFRLYYEVFALLLERLGAALEDVDSSGSLTAVLSTIILLIGSSAYAFVALPSFVMNSPFASTWQRSASLLYYALAQAAASWFLFTGTTGSYQLDVAVFVINESFTFVCVFLGIIVTWAGSTRPELSYASNRLSACRVYCRVRLSALLKTGTAVKTLKAKNAALSHNSMASLAALEDDLKAVVDMRPSQVGLDKKQWELHSHGGTGRLLFSAWYPRTEVLRAADVVFEIPPVIWSSVSVGCVVLIVVALQLDSIAQSAYDFCAGKVEELNSTLALVQNSSKNIPVQAQEMTQTVESIESFLQSQLDFYSSLATPAYQAILGGGISGLIWTLSFVPSVFSGFKRGALELRLGISDLPGFSHKARDSEMPPYRVLYLVGAYISCVGFSTLLAAFLFGLVILLFAWPPFLKLVWALNFLYLPSLVVMCLNIFLYGRFDKTFHDKTKVGGVRTSMDLIRPYSFSIVELGLLIGYFPGALLASFMRCVYIVCVALLGVLRVDTTLLPTGLQTFDSPYFCVAALLLRQNKVTSPVVLVASDMFLASSRTKRTADELRRTRIRNRLYLMVLLDRFPHLCAYRVQVKPEGQGNEDATVKSNDVSVVVT